MQSPFRVSFSVIWRAVLLSCLVCVTGQAHEMPSYGLWRSSRFGGGGYVLQVVISQGDPSRCYANVDVGGLYRSDDGGRSWRMLHGNLPPQRGNYSVRGIWIDPGDPDCLLIATGERWDRKQGIYRSTNGGGTWEKTYDAWFWGNGPRRAAGNVLVGDPGDADRVYLAAINDGFAISTDKGKSWRDTGELKGLYPTAIWVDSFNPNRIWVACYDHTVMFEGENKHFPQGLYRSENRGLSFDRINGGDISELMQLPWGDRALIGIVGEAHVATSGDNGATWSPLEEGLPIDEFAASQAIATSASAFNSMAVGPDFVLVGSRSGVIYRLEEGAPAWRQVKPEQVREGTWWGRMEPGKWQNYGKAMSSITISPAAPERWFTTDWYGVYRSADAGKTWDLSLDGIEVTVVHSIAVDPHKSSVIHVGLADNGSIRSEDGGMRFTKPSGGPSNVKHIAASCAAEGLLYKVGPTSHEWLANQLYRSTDGGKSWSRCQMRGLPDMSAHRCNSVGLDPTNSKRLWLAVSGRVSEDEGGVYVSADGGESFAWDSHGMSGAEFFATSIWQAGPELAVGGNGSMIASSAAERAVFTRPTARHEWRRADLDLPPYGKPSCVAAGIQSPEIMAVAVRGMGVYLSFNSGRTFGRVWEGDASYLALDPKVPSRIAVSTNQGVLLSSDRGQGFEFLDRGLPDRVTRLPLAFSGDRLIVGTAGSGMFFLDLPKQE